MAIEVPSRHGGQRPASDLEAQRDADGHHQRHRLTDRARRRGEWVMASMIEADLRVDLEVADRPTVQGTAARPVEPPAPRGRRPWCLRRDPGRTPSSARFAESLAARGVGGPGREQHGRPPGLARRRQRTVVAASRHRVATDPARQRPRRDPPRPAPGAAAPRAVLPDVTMYCRRRPSGPPSPPSAGRAASTSATTHDPARGGSPRLVLAKEAVWAGERQPVFPLLERTTIGSDAGSDVRPARTRAAARPSSSTTNADELRRPTALARTDPGARRLRWRPSAAAHGRPDRGRRTLLGLPP